MKPAEQIQRVRRVVEKHFPLTAKNDRETGQPPSLLHAYGIMMHHKAGSGGFDVSLDVERLEEITRSMRRAYNAYADLDVTIKNTAHEMIGKDFINGRDILANQLEILVNLFSAFGTVPFLKEKGDPRINYRAACIASGCRKVWFTEKFLNRENERRYQQTLHWLATHNIDDFDQQFRDFERKHVPRSQHSDRPGPMGKFIEGVFSALDILQKNGDVVKAATALVTLEKLKRK